MLRVAVYFPEAQKRVGGGDWIQVQRTVEALHALGLARVEVLHTLPKDLDGYDLLHVFNLLRATDLLEPLTLAASARRPVVLSSVYWDDRPYRLHGQWKRPSEADPLGRMVLQAEELSLEADTDLRRIALQCVDAVVALSQKELAILRDQFQPPSSVLTAVAYNGIDELFFGGDPERFSQQHHLCRFILSVGRIEDRKNQLSLIRAARGLDLPLVIVGSPLHQVDYYQQCLHEGQGRVLFLPRMRPEELADAYAAAEAFALPSWLDPAPLVCLEAAAGGCAVVTSPYGAVDEYLEGQCWICDPSSVESLRQALIQALKARQDRRSMRQRVHRFTWAQTARQVAEVYRQVVDRGWTPKPIDEGWAVAVARSRELAELRHRIGSIVGNYLERVSSSLHARNRLWHRFRGPSRDVLDLKGQLKVDGIPGQLAAGAVARVTFELANLGNDLWPDASIHAWPVNVGYRWCAGSRGVLEGRCFLPGPLPPGGRAEWQDVIAAPQQPGRYQLIVGLVHEDRLWSGQAGGPELTFSVEVV